MMVRISIIQTGSYSFIFFRDPPPWLKHTIVWL